MRFIRYICGRIYCMEQRLCEGCEEPINLLRSDAVVCSTKCRVRVHRRKKAAVRSRDALFESRRFVRARRRMPLQVSGRLASSTNPRTWSTFDAVQDGPGDGFGFMLGDGWGCYDLDDVSDDDARSFIESIPEKIIFCERSLSGKGVHVFVEAPESRGWKRTVDGLSVERYTRARFIRMTLDEFTT